MLKKYITTLLVAGFLGITMVDARPALACSCAVPPSPKVALEQTTAVFAGKVVNIEQSERALKVTLNVSRYWKGITAPTAVVTTATNSAACGYSFKADGEYLVYANDVRGHNELVTSICSRTKLLESAKADLTELGEGKPAPLSRVAEIRELEKLISAINDGLRVNRHDKSIAEREAAAERESIAMTVEVFTRLESREDKIAFIGTIQGSFAHAIPVSIRSELLGVLLFDANLSVRTTAARAIGFIKAGKQHRGGLVRLTENADDITWNALIYAMGESDDDFFKPYLLTALKAGSPANKMLALPYLRLPAWKDAGTIAEALKSTSVDTRLIAANALGAWIGDMQNKSPQAEKEKYLALLLQVSQNDTDQLVREAADVFVTALKVTNTP